jgi:uncharacterized lipoprotein YddW (UPF0748 family)
MKRIIFVVLTAACVLALAAGTRAGRDSGLKMAVRGVWAHPGTFGPDKEKAVPLMRKTLDEYVQAGIDTVIMMIKGTDGYVYYKSAIGVGDPAYNWDFFDVFLKEAKARNIAVHPWFCVFPETGILGQVRQNPEWLIRSRRNEIVGAANPALPEVRKYELGMMMEVAKNYPVDWIHLDYIRFPCEPAEPYFSFDPRTRALFKDYSGWDPLDIKAQDSGNMIWNEWLEWNRNQVTAFVDELREALKSTGRPVKISAAVFLDANNARVLIGQDWARWAEQGLVDMLCPMLYTNHEKFFEKYVKRAVAIGKGRCQVCPGIGIASSHNQNTPEGMIRQMKISQDCGADGVIFFSSGSLTAPFLEKLKTAD